MPRPVAAACSLALAVVPAKAEGWCRSSDPDVFPKSLADLGDVVGLADNACCEYYVALSPSAVVRIDTDGFKVSATNKQIIPAETRELLGASATVGDIDFWDSSIFAPVSNGTHSVLITLKYDLSFGAVSDIVDEPLTWVAADYNNELAYAGGAEASKVVTFDVNYKIRPNVTVTGETVALTPVLQGVAGAALKSFKSVYVVTEQGTLHSVNVTSGEVAAVGGEPLDAPVRGLANLWRYSSGQLHTATPTQICHYNECQSALVSV